MRRNRPGAERSAAAVLLLAMLLMAGGSGAARSGPAEPAPPAGIRVTEDGEKISISTSRLEAAVRKKGYVSGVAGGSFLDRKTGFRDAGFGLDIVDWIMEPGSDAAYRDRLPGDLPYVFNNLYHGKRAKRSIEGPQICTKAREVSPEVIRGRDFVAVRTRYRYHLAAPGKKTGSEWEQLLVFPEGRRYFLSTDRIASVNDSDAMFLRIDMPGHIRHQRGDRFSEVYLSYYPRRGGRIPASEFFTDFPPDEKFHYLRERDGIPRRFIRAYRLRDPQTGKDGPWLAGMTLDPWAVYEAWCHQRGYVCMIEEFGGRPIRAGESFSAAFIVGYFDSIEEMHRVYDRHAGATSLAADAQGWRLVRPDRLREEERVARRIEKFRDQKFGFFVHWGPYSQWGCIESWPLVEADTWARPDHLAAWTQRGRDLARFQREYWALNRSFDPARFDPSRWAEAARAAGMRYFVFTTKHHDGFSMFDTRLSDYRITAPDCPYSRRPRPDVTRELFEAFRARGFGIGAYFSKADWRHPDYWSPDLPARTRNPNYDPLQQPEKWGRFREFVHGQVEELMSRYGPIDILWLDAGQVRPPRQDLQMDRLVAMARRHQPDLIVVDRTVGGRHENYRTPEQQVPDEPLDYPWETCMTMGDQWSFRPDDRYKSTRQLIHLLVDVVAKGGNLLLNVGPQPDGELPPEALDRMRELGAWLRLNGEAIYGTRPAAPYKQGRICFTRKEGVFYALYLAGEGEELPPSRLVLPGIRPLEGSRVRLLGSPRDLHWRAEGEGAVIEIPEPARRALKSRHAWAVRFTP